MATSIGSWKSQQTSFKKKLIYASLTMIKIHCVDHNKLQKILRHVNTRLPTCLLRDLCPGHETTVNTRYRRTDDLKLRRKTLLYCHPIDLTYMQSTSWKMLGWRKYKLKLRENRNISRNINNLRYADDTTHMAYSKE